MAVLRAVSSLECSCNELNPNWEFIWGKAQGTEIETSTKATDGVIEREPRTCTRGKLTSGRRASGQEGARTRDRAGNLIWRDTCLLSLVATPSLL
jgi:hypothetical protein